MHILHLSLSGPPIPAIYGGAIQQTVQELSLATVEKGHRVTVISRALKEHKNLLEEANKTAVNYKYVYAKSNSRKSILLNINKYLKVIQENGPYDVIHIHAPYAALLCNIIRKKIGDPKIVWHVHNRSPLAPIVKSNKRIRIVGISKSVLQGIGGAAESDRYSVIHNICRESKFPLGKVEDKIKARKSFNIDEGKFIISFAGRVVPEKGIHVLIDAIKKLDEVTKTNIVLMVAGSSWFKDEEKSEFEKKVYKESKLIDVKWLGYVDNWELYKVYHASNIFVVPSVWEEPAGQVVIEAQSSGVGVIASNVGGIPEYLSPYEKTVKPNDPNDLARAIQYEYENKDSYEISDKRAHWIRENFSIEKIANEWVKFYKES